MTDYINSITANNTNYPIGGDTFDGRWVNTRFSILSNATLAAKTAVTYSLSNYLPNDNYTYEVIFSGGCQSNGAKSDLCQLMLYTGTADTTTAANGLRLDRAVARTANTVLAGASAILPIYPNDKNITVYTIGAVNANKNTYLSALGYRRIGTND